MVSVDPASTQWRKSSRSNSGNGGCVEVASVKTSRSASSGGSSVEAAPAAGRVAVRDSKNPSGPVLAFTTAEWRAFLTDVRARSHDPR